MIFVYGKGFYLSVSYAGFEEMTKSTEQRQINQSLPSQFRRTVTDDSNQFQLPVELVPEVGFQGSRTDLIKGPKVAWYYHEEDNKAVLANHLVDRATLELVGVCRLSGVSNEEFGTGDYNGARVTITSELPDSLYERLTGGDVVLKPVYADLSSELETTFVSVYPAAEYDRGDLPNVDHTVQVIECDNGPDKVESADKHANSI